MSLAHGDVHANSSRWLTAHRHSPYNDEDHLSPTASFLEPLYDRRYRFQYDDINLDIRHVKQFLAKEDDINEIKANSGA